MQVKYSQIFLFFFTLVTIIGVITFFSSSPMMAQSCGYHEEAYQGLTLAKLATELENTGLLGEIHGSVESSQLYVLSVREPDNFFNFRHFSLIAADEETQTTLAQMQRHDQVCVTGKLIENPSPQPHILVQSAKMLDSWNGLDAYGDYQYQANIPEELQQQTALVGKVHAMGNEGQILVIEYKDRILPIFVQNPELTANLYRGDLIRLSYQIQSLPNKPIHLQLNQDVDSPLTVIDRLVNRQGKEETLTGNLVKFPQSPQLKFDVYGLEVITQGIPRYFTLVNFEDAEEFQRIRDKLAIIWENHLNTIENGRNLLINRGITLKVEGTINVISPQQANPQILLKSADTIQESRA